MSLINQMLKDLAQREKIPTDPEVTLSGLLSGNAPRYEEDKKKFRLGMSLVFLVTGVFLLMTHKFAHRSIPVTNTSDYVVETKKQAINLNVSDYTLVDPVKITPSTLTGISLESNNGTTEMRFFLNHETSYRVSSNAMQTQLILTLEHANLIADLPPVDYIKSAIQGMQITNDKEGNLQITLSLNKGAEVNYLDMIPGEKSQELRLKLAYHPVAQNDQSIPAFSVKKTDEFNAKLQYENAMNLANLGDYNKAIESLSQLTDEYPNFITARQSLIALLLQQGNMQQARKVLEIGLQQKPYFPPLIEVKARMLVSQGKIIQALSLLERAPPPIEADPDYHAFIAALYREIGKAPRALRIYSQLVQINPGNAQYWAGLGIALEGSGKAGKAKAVYVHATQMSGLSPPLRNYLETRIENLS